MTSETPSRRPEPAVATSLPVYGLPAGFTGTRLLGDAQVETAVETSSRGERRSRQEFFGLLHGDPVNGPSLQVLSSAPGPLIPKEWLEREARRPALEIDLARIEPCWITIAVDGSATQFEGVRSGSSWPVTAPFAGIHLCVVGVYWPTDAIELVTIDDLSPYIEGRRRMLAEFRRTHAAPLHRPRGWQIIIDEPESAVVALYIRDVAGLRPQMAPAVPHLDPLVPQVEQGTGSASDEWANLWDRSISDPDAPSLLTPPDFVALADSPDLRDLVTRHHHAAARWAADQLREHIDIVTDTARYRSWLESVLVDLV